MNFVEKVIQLFLFLMLALTGISWGQSTYNLVTSTSDLVSGQKYIIASSATNGNRFALGYQNTNNRPQALITVSSNAISITPATSNTETTKVFELTLGGTSGAWTLYDSVNNIYLNK